MTHIQVTPRHNSNVTTRNLIRILIYIAESICIFCFSLLSQQTDFIPKGKIEIEKERQSEANERQKIVKSGIRTLMQTKYLFRFGIPERNGIPELTIHYNKAGRKTEEIRYNEFDKSEQSRTLYKYDNKGNLIEEKLIRDGKENKTTYRYNSLGKVSVIIYYKPDGMIEKKMTNIYDRNGLLLETIGYLNDGRTFSKDMYFYDTRGNCVEFRNNLNKFNYSYDERGNLSTITKFTRYFKSTDSVQYLFTDQFVFNHDKNNNLISLEHYRSDSVKQNLFLYTVDYNGNLLEEKELGVDGKSVFQRVLMYDNKGNLIEETGLDHGRKFRNTYKFDTRNNKTEWIQYDQLNEPSIVTKYFYTKSSIKRSLPSSLAFNEINSSDGESISLDEYNSILGCRIVAPDGAYLGTILADTVNPQSIINVWGQYGYEESPSSIFNANIQYGGSEGIFSPFNIKSPSPPSLYKENKFYAYFTENTNFNPRISPRKIISLLKNSELAQE